MASLGFSALDHGRARLAHERAGLAHGRACLAHRRACLAHPRAGWHRRAHLAHPDRGDGRRKKNRLYDRIAPNIPDPNTGAKWIDKCQHVLQFANRPYVSPSCCHKFAISLPVAGWSTRPTGRPCGFFGPQKWVRCGIIVVCHFLR